MNCTMDASQFPSSATDRWLQTTTSRNRSRCMTRVQRPYLIITGLQTFMLSTSSLHSIRLRVPRYSAILRFVNIALLLVIFIACLWSRCSGLALSQFCNDFSAKDVHHVTFWESLFLVFAVAFTLQEFAASKEYGWTGQYVSSCHILGSDIPCSLHFQCKVIFGSILIAEVRPFRYGMSSTRRLSLSF